jgi:hypothetical protein
VREGQQAVAEAFRRHIIPHIGRELLTAIDVPMLGFIVLVALIVSLAPGQAECEAGLQR